MVRCLRTVGSVTRSMRFSWLLENGVPNFTPAGTQADVHTSTPERHCQLWRRQFSGAVVEQHLSAYNKDVHRRIETYAISSAWNDGHESVQHQLWGVGHRRHLGSGKR